LAIFEVTEITAQHLIAAQRGAPRQIKVDSDYQRNLNLGRMGLGNETKIAAFARPGDAKERAILRRNKGKSKTP
jgi:hypothetical protein